MPHSAPKIETSRLILRGHILEDFNLIAALWADPKMVRFLAECRLPERRAGADFYAMSAIGS